MPNFSFPCFPRRRHHRVPARPTPTTASFPLFTRFPVELQLAIWAFAAASEPQPEVCLLWPQNAVASRRRPYIPSLPLLVDTAWPAVAHVCRAAREAAFTSGAVQLRYSPTARCAVPYRRFIPAIDTLYTTRLQTFEMLCFLMQPEQDQLARDLRHLAVEMSGMRFDGRIALFIQRKASCLRTLSVVFPGTVDIQSPHVEFALPERRCVLRDVSDSALDRCMLIGGDPRPPPEIPLVSFRKYLVKQRERMDHFAHVHLSGINETDGMARSAQGDYFSGLEIKAQTFVEYSRDKDGREQWVEVCRDRLLPRGDLRVWPPRVPLGGRKNPEEYRVLDDDRGWHLREPAPYDPID